jgi:hypothetical protein
VVTIEGQVVCDYCGMELRIGDFPWCPHSATVPGIYTPAVHPKERTVIYENPRTGHVRYPGRADVPIPQRYADQGYQRREFPTRHELERFEKQRGVTNDKLWYNSGNTHCAENAKE